MKAFLASIDTLIMGRKTYEFAGRAKAKFFPGMANYVFSSSLPAGRTGEVEIVAEDAVAFTRSLKQQPGKDIWIFGGLELAASLLAAELVDEISLAVQPVLLGAGPQLFGPLAAPQSWRLMEAKPFPNGVVLLRYSR
jgi:dihydrofolate reductase